MKAKTLIAGHQSDAGPAYEGEEEFRRSSPPRPGGPPGPPTRSSRERMRPPGVSGHGGPAEQEGMLTSRERIYLKDLVLLDLLYAIGGDKYYTEIVKSAIDGTDLKITDIQHFLDEAPKFGSMVSPGVDALLQKLSKIKDEAQAAPPKP